VDISPETTGGTKGEGSLLSRGKGSNLPKIGKGWMMGKRVGKEGLYLGGEVGGGRGKVRWFFHGTGAGCQEKFKSQ